MNKIVNVILNRPVVCLLILIFTTLFLGKGLSGLETENTQDSELPEENILVKTKKNIEEIFGKKEIILIGIECDNIFTYETLSKIRDIEEELKEIEGVIHDETVSIVSINNIVGDDDGVEVGEYITEIPTDPKALNELREHALKNELMVERIISKDGRFSSIVANIEEGYNEEDVYSKVSEIVEKHSTPEYIFMSGDPIQQKEIDMGIQGDMRLLLPIALLLLILAYFFSFRSVLGVLLPISIVLLSIVWTMGAVYYLGYKITVVSSIIPILMLVISGSYGVHIMQKFYDEYKDVRDNVDEVRRKVIKIMFKPLFLTCITSALGMITLIVFKVKSIKEFGVIVSLGSLFTFIVTILLVSSVLWLIKNKKIKVSPVQNLTFLNHILLSISKFSVEKWKLVSVCSLLFLCISLWGAFNVKIGNDFIEYFPKDHRLTTAYEKFNDNLGGASYIDIMFEGKNIDDIKSPDFLNKMDSLLEYAKSNYEYIGNSFSVVDIVKRMNKELHGGDAQYDQIPDNNEEIAQYLLLYSMSGNPGDFNSIVDYDYQRTKVRMMLTSSEQDSHKEIYNGLLEYVDKNFDDSMSIEFGGEVIFWLAQIDYIVLGKIENIIMAVLIVLLVCTLAFCSFKYGLISIIPLTLASLFTFGIMGFLGVRLETATALITSIGIGIGVDFAIHYLFSLRRNFAHGENFNNSSDKTMVSTGKAIVLDVFTTILGFMVFIFSGFVPIQHFGLLITLTMIGSCITTLFTFPALIKIFKIKIG
ncbi:MAG: MMPL family transporter [Tannerellaceae bacterium]|jgi:predicted RND superfamily exporter protein|nr:MMPL family transporter [Tannerellaceae bacterium]